MIRFCFHVYRYQYVKSKLSDETLKHCATAKHKQCLASLSTHIFCKLTSVDVPSISLHTIEHTLQCKFCFAHEQMNNRPLFSDWSRLKLMEVMDCIMFCYGVRCKWIWTCDLSHTYTLYFFIGFTVDQFHSPSWLLFTTFFVVYLDWTGIALIKINQSKSQTLFAIQT